MRDRDFIEIVLRGVDALGIKVPEDIAGKLILYRNMLECAAAKHNLTAITSPADMARLHFLDSLAILTSKPFNLENGAYFKQSECDCERVGGGEKGGQGEPDGDGGDEARRGGATHTATGWNPKHATQEEAGCKKNVNCGSKDKSLYFSGKSCEAHKSNQSCALGAAASFLRVTDIGSGAGFPGVPIKLARPDTILTLIDASEKRVDFLINLCEALEIDAMCLHERAEVAAHKADFREMSDVVVSRAVARLSTLCELCLPHVRVGGFFIAMKGVEAEIEAKEAHTAIEALGAAMRDIVEYSIDGLDVIRRLVVIEKTAATDLRLPRRYSKIKRNPL